MPGFLVVAAVIYAAVTSTSMVYIGRHFVAVSESKNQAEAEYRYALTRVRENGESIALLGGEEEERDGIDKTFASVIKQWALLCGQHMRTTIVSQGSSLIAPVIPLLLCAPKFLDGSMTLGQVMQAASAFTIVQSAFGWLVDNYPRLADWNACARRIASLMMSIDGLDRAERGDGIGRIQRGETEGDAVLSLNDLSVTLDDGTAVVEEAEVIIDAGERVLVAGESGTGKSTLVRAIAGLWPWGTAVSISIRTVGCSCFRKSPTFRLDHCAARRRIRLPRKTGQLRRSALLSTKWVLGTSRSDLRKKHPGTRRFRAAKSSASPSPGCFCITPTLSCWTKQRPRSMQKARIK